MSFDERDVRVGLDVFSADEEYLGTVVRVRWEGRGWLRREAPPWAGTRVPAELLVLRMMTSLDWSSVRPRLRRIPAGLIQAVALERIVVSVTAAELA